MQKSGKRIRARFYRSGQGVEPVREWLKELAREDCRKIGIDVKSVEFGWPIGMPLCKPLGDGLWEVRTDLGRGRIARVIFAILDGEMILLHGFIKKSQKISAQDLNLAKMRKRTMEDQLEEKE